MVELQVTCKKYYMLPKNKCDYCRESRHLTEQQKTELMYGQIAPHECLLCGATDYSVCKKCFIPWKPGYIESGNLVLEEYESYIKAKVNQEGQFVCALCIVEREIGIEGELDPETQKLIRAVRMLYNVYGPPPIELISSQTLCIPTGRSAEEESSWGGVSTHSGASSLEVIASEEES